MENMDPDPFQGWAVKWMQLAAREIWHMEKYLNRETKQILEQATQKASGISVLEDAQNATGQPSNLVKVWS